MIRMHKLFLFLIILISFSSVQAFGDFPLASCKGNGGTIIEKTGVNSTKALMKGIITKADMHEYCERDPGGSTIKNGGTQTLDSCVESGYLQVKDTQLIAIANCETGVLIMRGYRHSGEKKVRFPLAQNADKSCASGMPPLIEQFKILCPKAAAQLKM
jgi:hypothetical protein